MNCLSKTENIRHTTYVLTHLPGVHNFFPSVPINNIYDSLHFYMLDILVGRSSIWEKD
jgi:hypothetical protein